MSYYRKNVKRRVGRPKKMRTFRVNVVNKYGYGVAGIFGFRRKGRSGYIVKNYKTKKSKLLENKKQAVSYANLIRRTTAYSYANSGRYFARALGRQARRSGNLFGQKDY